MLSYMAIAYPNGKYEPNVPTVNLWWKFVSGMTYAEAEAAVDAHIATSRFPPTPADIRDQYARAQSEARGDLTAGEAWGKVRRAVSRFGYYQPEAAREFLGATLWAAIDQIGGWAYLCTTEDDTSTLSAQFERRYKAAAEQQKYRDMVPLQVQEHLKALGAGQGLKMIGGDTNP